MLSFCYPLSKWQAALGGGVGNLQRIRAFLRVCLNLMNMHLFKYYTMHFFFKESLILVFAVQIRLRDYGALDFDAGDARRQPPVDTTWQQVLDTLSDYKFSRDDN